jgi:hypothetical protein
MSGADTRAGLPAVVLVAHDKPRHLRRLLAALAPLPVFLHIDANTPEALHAEMTASLPDHVRLQPRLAAGWARFEVLQAELDGYRAALTYTDAAHIILATGADYLLTDVETIVSRLAQHPERSYAEVLPLPIADWGPMRGYDRFLFRSRPWRGHRLIWPVPRRLPRGLRLGGGAQTKILTRRHAQLVLHVLDDEPRLLRWFRRCWTPDEVVLPTLLLSERYGAHWAEEGSSHPHPWYIDWGDAQAKNPRWLDLGDLDALQQAARRPEVPALFARKFAEDSDALVASIDAGLRTRTAA